MDTVNITSAMRGVEMSSEVTDKIVTMLGLQELNPEVRARVVLKIHKIASVKALMSAFELLDETNKKALGDMIETQTSESEMVRVRSMLDFFTLRKINYSRMYFEEIHKLKIALIRKERTRKQTERGLNFIEKVIGTIVVEEVNSLIIPSELSDGFEAGQLVGESIGSEPVRTTLSRSARWRVEIIKFVLTAAIIVLVEFAIYAISYLLYQRHVIAGMPVWVDSSTPSFIKTLCRYLLH